QSSVLAALAEGPKSARDVSEVVDHDLPERHRGHWGWNPSQVKVALEALFAGGIISAAGRNDHFERIYALTRDVSAELPEIPLSYGTGARPRLGLDPDASLPRGGSGVEDNVLDLTRVAARALVSARWEDRAECCRRARARVVSG